MGAMFLTPPFQSEHWHLGHEQGDKHEYMFYNAAAFNQDIGIWNTSAVANMLGMFHGAADFNQDLSSWNASSLSFVRFCNCATAWLNAYGGSITATPPLSCLPDSRWLRELVMPTSAALPHGALTGLLLPDNPLA